MRVLKGLSQNVALETVAQFLAGICFTDKGLQIWGLK